MDPSNAKDFRRFTCLAIKDASDFEEIANVRENKKTGRAEADDDNDTRGMHLLWCDALPSALNPSDGELPSIL